MSRLNANVPWMETILFVPAKLTFSENLRCLNLPLLVGVVSQKRSLSNTSFVFTGQIVHGGKFKHLKYSENFNFPGTNNVDSILVNQWKIVNTHHVFFSLLQVIDFGSSCYEHQRVYTYIQSRFYRAPEVILGARYGMPIDMWSLGCILAELLTGYPLLPGEDEGDQLSCIIELLGMPPQKLLDQSKRAKNFISSKGLYLI